MTQNFAKSFDLFEKAAKQGMLEAHHALGTAYTRGQGTDHDRCRAFRHFKKAADAGLILAQFDLGACYSLGYGVEKNFSKAAECFFLAAEGGNPQAQLCLGQFFEKGQAELPKDLAKATHYYQLAANQGLKEAKSALKRLPVV